MNTKIRLSRALTAVAAVAAAGSVATAALSANGSSGAGPDSLPTSTIAANHPMYEDVGELTASSTLVVRGTATKVLPAQRVLPPDVAPDQLAPEKRERAGFLTTDVVFSVDKVVAGSSAVAGQEIVVTHLGGEDAVERFVVEHEDLSRPGQSYVLFLRQGPDGRYAVVGGGQGRYPTRNGRITLLSEAVANAPVAAQLEEMATDTFDRDFSRLAGAPLATS